jgi:hypothetical protein
MKLQETLASLEPLFEMAEKEGLWFHNKCQNLWLSPKMLREQCSRGSYIWGPQNWTLKDPNELIESLEIQIIKINKRIEDIRQEIRGKS